MFFFSLENLFSHQSVDLDSHKWQGQTSQTLCQWSVFTKFVHESIAMLVLTPFTLQKYAMSQECEHGQLPNALIGSTMQGH